MVHPSTPGHRTPPHPCFRVHASPRPQVKPIHWGFADNRSMFVSFEGQVNARTPKFSVRASQRAAGLRL